MNAFLIYQLILIKVIMCCMCVCVYVCMCVCVYVCMEAPKLGFEVGKVAAEGSVSGDILWDQHVISLL